MMKRNMIDTGHRDWDEDRAERLVLVPTWLCEGALLLVVLLLALLASGCRVVQPRPDIIYSIETGDMSGYQLTGVYIWRNGKWIPVLPSKIDQPGRAQVKRLKWL